LVRISQRTDSNKPGDFALYEAKINSTPAKVTVKSKVDAQSKEQYAPGILIDNTNRNLLEKANIILINYLDNLKGEGSINSLRIKDYKIKVIKIEKQTDKNILFSAECSILPFGNYSPPPGKEMDDQGWYNNIFYSISVFAEDNVYYIDNLSSSF
jgi:hypothetical protein